MEQKTKRKINCITKGEIKDPIFQEKKRVKNDAEIASEFGVMIPSSLKILIVGDEFPIEFNRERDCKCVCTKVIFGVIQNFDDFINLCNTMESHSIDMDSPALSLVTEDSRCILCLNNIIKDQNDTTTNTQFFCCGESVLCYNCYCKFESNLKEKIIENRLQGGNYIIAIKFPSDVMYIGNIYMAFFVRSEKPYKTLCNDCINKLFGDVEFCNVLNKFDEVTVQEKPTNSIDVENLGNNT